MSDRRYSRRSFVCSAVLAAAGAGAPALARRSGWQRRGPPIRGRVIARGDVNYEEWRQGMPWQMDKPARYPELIVQPLDTADVIAAIHHARRHGLRVAVKSGGHNVWSNFLRDGGMLLDLSQLCAVQVDAANRRAAAGPAVWGRNLMLQTLPHGLGFPVAHCATVPLGGFLLGGGFGLNGDEWGTLSCFAVEGAEVVTAAGDPLRVDARTNPELFWALRGGGNGFPGVVTRYDLQLFPAPAQILASTYVFPGVRIAEVAALARAIAGRGPPHTEILGITAIGGKASDGRNQVICALRIATFAPEETVGRAILETVAREPLAREAMMKMEFVAGDWESQFLDSIDASRGFGFGRYAVDNLWTDAPEPVMERLAEGLAVAPSPLSHAVVQFKVRTTLPAAAALSCIAPAYAGVYSVWRDPSLGDAARAWLRSTMQTVEPYARGHYINEIDAEYRPGRVAASFSPAAWKRLNTLRARFDPGGVFYDFFGRDPRHRGEPA